MSRRSLHVPAAGVAAPDSIMAAVASHYGAISSRPYGDRKRVGIEAEFPIFSLSNAQPPSEILKGLVEEIGAALGFSPEGVESGLSPTEVVCRFSGDTISYEFCYSSLEFSLSPCTDLLAAKARLESYVAITNRVLSRHRLFIKGHGLNISPWCKNFSNVENARYDAIALYLREFAGKSGRSLDPQFNKIICSTQTHIEVGYADIAQCMNIINATGWIRAILFANSPMEIGAKRWLLSRDLLWEKSAFFHGDASVGTQDRIHAHYEDVLHEILDRPVYLIFRDGRPVFFNDCTVGELVAGRRLHGRSKSSDGMWIDIDLYGRVDDLKYFRSYSEAAPTVFGTIEIRGDCQQPFECLLTPAAFHAGLLTCREEAADYLAEALRCNSLRQLREQACLLGYDLVGRVDMDLLAIIRKCLDIAYRGLESRGCGEEVLLEVAYENLDARLNPALIHNSQKSQCL